MRGRSLGSLLALLLFLVAACTAAPAQQLRPESGRLGIRFTFRGDGLVVCGIDPGGPAEAAGVKAQDVILAVNDRPLSSLDEESWMRWFGSLRDGDRVDFTIGNRVVTIVASR